MPVTPSSRREGPDNCWNSSRVASVRNSGWGRRGLHRAGPAPLRWPGSGRRARRCANSPGRWRPPSPPWHGRPAPPAARNLTVTARRAAQSAPATRRPTEALPPDRDHHRPRWWSRRLVRRRRARRATSALRSAVSVRQVRILRMLAAISSSARPARAALGRRRRPPRSAGRGRRADPALQLGRGRGQRQPDQDDQEADVRPGPASACSASASCWPPDLEAVTRRDSITKSAPEPFSLTTITPACKLPSSSSKATTPRRTSTAARSRSRRPSTAAPGGHAGPGRRGGR